MDLQLVEVGRIRCTDHVEVVISKASSYGTEIGLMLTKFVTSNSHTGPKKNAFLIPKDQVKNLRAVLKC